MYKSMCLSSVFVFVCLLICDWFCVSYSLMHLIIPLRINIHFEFALSKSGCLCVDVF